MGAAKTPRAQLDAVCLAGLGWVAAVPIEVMN